MLAVPFVDYTDVAVVLMGSTFGLHRLAVDLFAVHSYLGMVDDDVVEEVVAVAAVAVAVVVVVVAAVAVPIDVIAIESLMLAFAQSDLVVAAADFVLVRLAHLHEAHVPGELNMIAVVVDLTLPIVAVAARFYKHKNIGINILIDKFWRFHSSSFLQFELY